MFIFVSPRPRVWSRAGDPSVCCRPGAQLQKLGAQLERRHLWKTKALGNIICSPVCRTHVCRHRETSGQVGCAGGNGICIPVVCISLIPQAVALTSDRRHHLSAHDADSPPPSRALPAA